MMDIKVVRRATEALRVMGELRDIEVKCSSYGHEELMVWLSQQEGSWFMLTCWASDALAGYAICVPPHLLNSRIHVIEAKGRPEAPGVVKALMEKVVEGCRVLGAKGVSMDSQRSAKVWEKYGFKQTSICFVMDPGDE